MYGVLLKTSGPDVEELSEDFNFTMEDINNKNIRYISAADSLKGFFKNCSNQLTVAPSKNAVFLILFYTTGQSFYSTCQGDSTFILPYPVDTQLGLRRKSIWLWIASTSLSQTWTTTVWTTRSLPSRSLLPRAHRTSLLLLTLSR